MQNPFKKQKPENPYVSIHFYKKGDSVKAQILTLDKENRKMSLGVKQMTPDPWADISVNFPVGSKHSVLVKNFTNFGGLDGLFGLQ